jgi:hypothetical protein
MSDSNKIDNFSSYVDLFMTTMQFPLSTCKILISLLSFKDFKAMDSIPLMLDVKGLNFSNIDQILQLNSISIAGGSSDITYSAAHAMSRLNN